MGQMDIPIPLRKRQAIIQKSTSFVMLARRMYHRGQDGILRLCIELEEKNHYLKLAHKTIGGIHMASNQTLKRLLWRGIWWPTMKGEASNFVQACIDYSN